MEELLMVFAKKAGCFYLSDLPQVYPLFITKQFILNIPNHHYPLKQWNNVVSYFIHQEITFSTIEEAKSYLCRLVNK